MTKHKEPNITQQDLNEIPVEMRETYVIREARCRMPQDGDKNLLHGVFNDEDSFLYYGSKQACIDYCTRIALPYKIK